MITIQQFLQATRSPETAPQRGGPVTPADSISAAMLAWQAGEDGEARRSTPATAMICARAPLTCPALKERVGHSGVKSASAGNWPSEASLGSEGISRKVEGSAAESWSQRNQPARDLMFRAHAGTKIGKGTRNPRNRMDNAPGGQKTTRIISGRPGRMPHFSPTAKCHDGTWTPPRALGPQGPSRISAACARWAGNRPSERPGQCPGYAKSGDATSKYTNKANP